MKDLLYVAVLFFMLIFPKISFSSDVKISVIWGEDEECFFPGNLHRVTCQFQINSDQNVILLVRPEKPLKLLSPTSYKILALKDTVHTSSIKLYLPHTFDTDEFTLKCTFILQTMDGNKTILAQETLALDIKEKIVVKAKAPNPNISIRASDTLVSVPIHLQNLGNKYRDIRLQLKNYPEGLKVLEQPDGLRLEAGKDTVVHYQVRPDKNWKEVHASDLLIELMDVKDDKKIDNCRVTAFPLGHIKKYYYPASKNNVFHELKMGLNHRSKTDQILDFGSRGRSPFLKGLMNYEVQSFYYPGSGNLELSSARLQYYDTKRTLTLGQIFYSDEVSLSGKGFIYGNALDSQLVYLGVINNKSFFNNEAVGSNRNESTNLIGGLENALPFIGLVQSDALVSITDNYNSGFLWMGKNVESKTSEWGIRLGLSGMKEKGPAANPFQTGWVIKADYEKEIDTWSLSSQSRISSPNYAGAVAGNLFTTNRFTYSGWKTLDVALSTRFRKFKDFVEKEATTFERSGYQFKYQTSFGFKNMGYWKLQLNPYQVFEKRNFIDYANPEIVYSALSSRIMASLSRKKDGYSMALKSESGFFRFGETATSGYNSFPYRLSFSLSGKSLSFYTGYQSGTTNLSTAIDQVNNETVNSSLIVSTRWNKWLIKKKLKTSFSNQVSYSNLRKIWSSSSTAKVKSVFPKGWAVDAECTLFNTLLLHDVFWNMRLTKKLETYKSTEGAKKLTISLFEDANNNGLKEADENKLSGILVKINEIPLVSGNDGWIQYKAAPQGSYTLSLIDPTGAFAGKTQTIHLTENTELQIPLFKTIALTGIVTEVKQRFKSSKFSLTGVPVIAKNALEETFVTYTTPKGTFSLNLPAGEYTVYIDPAAFSNKFEFPDNFKQVLVVKDKTPEVALSVKVKSRKMNVTKF